MPVVVVPQAHVSAIRAVKAKAEASDGRRLADCFMDVMWMLCGRSVDVPLATNFAARGAGCSAGLRNLEPMGRGQDCLLAFAAGFGDHYFDSD